MQMSPDLTHATSHTFLTITNLHRCVDELAQNLRPHAQCCVRTYLPPPVPRVRGVRVGSLQGVIRLLSPVIAGGHRLRHPGATRENAGRRRRLLGRHVLDIVEAALLSGRHLFDAHLS